MNIFPIKLYAYQSQSGHTNSESAFKDLFYSTKSKDMVWYAYDVHILSTNQVEFIVYDMRDSFHGGIGKEIGRYKVFCETKLTDKFIDKRLMEIAVDRRRNELEQIEQDIIDSYYKEAKQKYLEHVKETEIMDGMRHSDFKGRRYYGVIDPDNQHGA